MSSLHSAIQSPEKRLAAFEQANSQSEEAAAIWQMYILSRTIDASEQTRQHPRVPEITLQLCVRAFQIHVMIYT